MAGDNDPARLLLPYLQRADELQKHEPLVAYYCRLYAMERGLKIPQSERTKTTNSILVSLMKQLEKDKKSLQLAPDDNLHLEGFASNVFAKADKQDRAGRADLNTAKTFYAASIFFEILNQFGEVQPDLEQKQKYAAWKAADIRKAIKEGRKPIPGPPDGDKDLSSIPSGGFDLEPSRGDMAIPPASASDPSSHLYDNVGPQHFPNDFPSTPTNFPSPSSSNIPPPAFSNIPPPASSNIPPPAPSNIPPPASSNIPPPASSNIPSSHTYPTDEYPSHNYSHHPSTDRAENPTYSQPYSHQSYPHEPQQHLPQNYQPHEAPYTYPNFQSYPSFPESSIPAVPSNYPPSYYQGPDTSYSPPSAPKPTNYPTTTHYNSSSVNGTVSETAPPSAQSYQYDSNYQPPPEKIAEAHKAARFAVGALAFDDVFVAVDYLRKSLELLTNPSAGH